MASDIRLLVVYSDAGDLAVLASVAAANGFGLRVIESGDVLADEVSAFEPDAVVLDVEQRGVSGFELCHQLKLHPSASLVPVILTGSSGEPEVRRRAFAVGCDDFFEKPIDRQVLGYRLRSFARLRRAWSRDAAVSMMPRLVRTQGRGRLADMCARFGTHLGLAREELTALAHAAILREIVGAELPRVARVFQLLEAFEALTHDQPHHKARTTDEAIALLRADAATGDIDPEVLGTFATWLGEQA